MNEIFNFLHTVANHMRSDGTYESSIYELGVRLRVNLDFEGC